MPDEKQREALTTAEVGEQLIGMFITIKRTERRVGPKPPKTALPYIIREILPGGEGDAEDSVVWLNQHRIPNHSRATKEQIDMMDEALGWPMRFLKDYPRERKCLLSWAYATAHKIPTKPLGLALGVSKSEFDRARTKALLVITKGLARERARKAA